MKHAVIPHKRYRDGFVLKEMNNLEFGGVEGDYVIKTAYVVAVKNFAGSWDLVVEIETETVEIDTAGVDYGAILGGATEVYRIPFIHDVFFRKQVLSHVKSSIGWGSDGVLIDVVAGLLQA